MAVVIEKKADAPLLDKTLVHGYALSETTIPSKEEVKKELAKQLAVSEDLITVEHMYTTFGLAKARFVASAYTTPKAKDFFKKKEKKAAAPAGGA